MKHIIIGTAGHIDHGKTTLIKALTGAETDTLAEEKKRGISINLGFTHFDLPSGRRAGIIDVPGHEKFIKNMLAGISSIDVVLLVIAADEGIMPQTREHFEILQLLNVKKGIIVLTKVDLVDREWVDMIKEDIRNEFENTFLEGAQIHEVSSVTREGIPELISDIDNITETVAMKDTEGHFRLPVDRAFTVSGFGTVVTGTIISGNVKVGDSIEIYPNKIESKVRGIQVHGEPSEIGEAGQRCAINLSNIKLDQIGRGDVVATPDIMEPSMIIDCNIYYLKSMDKPLVNRQRVRLYHGTSEILCRVVILDREEIMPGENAYVQLRLEQPITAQRNDRYVIRSYSPMVTIGGGVIIEPVSRKVKRFNQEFINELKLKESGETSGILDNTINKLSDQFPDIDKIIKSLGKNEAKIHGEIEQLIESKRVIKLISTNKEIYIHAEFLKKKTKQIEELLSQYHESNPLKLGMQKEEIKNKIFGKNLKQRLYDEVLEILEENKVIKVYDKFISLKEFEIVLTEDQNLIMNNIIELYEKSQFNPQKYSDLISSEVDKKNFKMVYDMLIDNGTLIKTSEDCIFLNTVYEKAKETIVDYINQNGSIPTSKAKELLDTNRKYVVSLLENFDNIKLTKRIGNERALY